MSGRKDPVTSTGIAKELMAALIFSPQHHHVPHWNLSLSAQQLLLEGTLDLRSHPPKPDVVLQGCQEGTLFPRRALNSE